MTHSGGKPHEVGYRGQQYEVSVFDDNGGGRRVVGWTNDSEKARQMATAAELRPGWSAAWVTDLRSDISHTKHGKWIGERPLPLEETRPP